MVKLIFGDNSFKVSLAERIDNGIYIISKPTYRGFRAGDGLHSQADISKSKEMLGYSPRFGITEGAANVMPWYIKLKNNYKRGLPPRK